MNRYPYCLWSRSRHVLLALSSSLLIALLFGFVIRSHEKKVGNTLTLVEQARGEIAIYPLSKVKLPVPNTNIKIEPAEWPMRAEVNEVLRHAGETAQVNGVTLRTISVSQQVASVQAWGRITLDVSASGRYAALKAWQSAMQNHSSSLSLQSLRLQGNPSSGSGDLDAQAFWVLHVRD